LGDEPHHLIGYLGATTRKPAMDLKELEQQRKRQRIGIPFTAGPLQLLSGQRPERSQLLGIKITHHRQTLRQRHHSAPTRPSGGW
jgi:hypothetical protein